MTNSSVQADICRRKCVKFDGRVRVIVTDFDILDLPSESFDAIYALESIGYTKDLDAWLARCWRMLKPGGRLMIRSQGSLDHCRRQEDYRSVTAFFDNWRYNVLGSNLLVYKTRRLGFNPIRYRRLPFWAWGLTWNFLQHMLLWKYRLKMRTFVELEWIIWRTSKGFVFGNAYNTVLATKPAAAFPSVRGRSNEIGEQDLFAGAVPPGGCCTAVDSSEDQRLMWSSVESDTGPEFERVTIASGTCKYTEF